MPEAARSRELADDSFTPEKVGGELAYLDRPLSRGFERPYGWAWLLYLHLEARGTSESWAGELEPLARAFAERLSDLSRKSDLPDPRRHALQHRLRAGPLARMGGAVRSARWRDLIRDRALHWFGADRDCQAWEPGGDEFLSPALVEALCMARTHRRRILRAGSGISCPASATGSRRPCSTLRSSATAPTARSPISTDSTSAAPGAGAARGAASADAASGRAKRRRRSISMRRCRISQAIIWASIGSRASRLLALLAARD